MKKPNNIFVYDNLYFENGIKDKKGHPVVVAAIDNDNLYCFMMTSQNKHLYKNSHARNTYNQNIYYAQTSPGRNCQINNSLAGLIITSYCFSIPKEEESYYNIIGNIYPKLANEIITKWAYQQNEIRDKKVDNYDYLCTLFGINDNIKNSEMYKYYQDLMKNYPQELQFQRDYAKELRIYLEQKQQIDIENQKRKVKGLPRLSYPLLPKLKDDKTIFKKYGEDTSKEANNPLSELKMLWEQKEEKSPSPTPITESNNVVELREYKEKLLRYQQEQRQQEQQSQQETHHRRAA